jgi:soluble lytic murein transglycosylase-like protein
MIISPYRDLINVVAITFKLDPLLIEAIVNQESSHEADGFRFEPGFYRKYLKNHPDYQGQIPRRISSSYGLMQVMYSTARDFGFKGEPEELFVPRTSLTYGCRYFAYLLQKWAKGDVKKALAAYNGGPGNWDAAKPQAYAKAVWDYYQQLKS